MAVMVDALELLGREEGGRGAGRRVGRRRRRVGGRGGEGVGRRLGERVAGSWELGEAGSERGGGERGRGREGGSLEG